MSQEQTAIEGESDAIGHHAESIPTEPTARRPDPTRLSHWFPIIAAAGLPVPRTEIVVFPDDVNRLALDIPCTVPFGYWPEGYFVRVIPNWNFHPFELHTPEEVQRYLDDDDEGRKKYEASVRNTAAELARRPRSPFERMIDRACGLA